MTISFEKTIFEVIKAAENRLHQSRFGTLSMKLTLLYITITNLI